MKTFPKLISCGRIYLRKSWAWRNPLANLVPNQVLLNLPQRFSSNFKTPSSSFSNLNPNPISDDLIYHLERTSLVDFDNAEAVERLNEAISFANQLFEVNTDGVEPLFTVLENEDLYLREDVAASTNRTDVIKNACITEEDYFVAPPGNIPLEQTSKEYWNNPLKPEVKNDKKGEIVAG